MLEAVTVYVKDVSACSVNLTVWASRFTLQAETSFTYTVTASSTAGDYDFSGMLRDFERMDHDVGGASRITVEADAPTPTATRSFDPTSVAGGGQVVVTITAADYGTSGRGDGNTASGFHLRLQQPPRRSGYRSRCPDGQVHAAGGDVLTYTVTASSTAGDYDFSGMLRTLTIMTTLWAGPPE